MNQSSSRLWVPVAYDTLKAFRIEHSAGGTPMVVWVDEHGGLVESEAALGVRLERSPFEMVTFNYRDGLIRNGPRAHRTVPGMASRVGSGKQPDPSDETTYTIDSKPVERFLLPRLAWLNGGRQAAGGQGEVRIGPRQPDSQAPKSEYLDPARTNVPLDSSVVVASRAALAGESQPKAQARRLTLWVARTITADTARDAPALAVEVLNARRADAEGHAALLVGLARAAGIRARPVGGVARKDGVTYGHTWAELWIDGQWMAADPTFGQFPASSQLLRITVGGTGRAIDLVPLLGSATFEVISPPASR